LQSRWEIVRRGERGGRRRKKRSRWKRRGRGIYIHVGCESFKSIIIREIMIINIFKMIVLCVGNVWVFDVLM
jgi:hypothetical protein